MQLNYHLVRVNSFAWQVLILYSGSQDNGSQYMFISIVCAGLGARLSRDLAQGMSFVQLAVENPQSAEPRIHWQ